MSGGISTNPCYLVISDLTKIGTFNMLEQLIIKTILLIVIFSTT